MDSRFRFVVGLLTALNALLVVVLCGVVMNVRGEVRGLESVLATKQDLVNATAPAMTVFAEQKCTTCHAERRFLGVHNTRGEMEQALAHMSAMPDTDFTDEDMAKIHSSLALLRCTQCHGADKLRMLKIKSPEERMRVIREMIAKPGSNVNPDEAEAILNSYQQMMGF